MNFVYIGKIVNTHGIKGEVRLLSDFKEKELIFKKGFNVYIGESKAKETINSYRCHKQFDMLTFENINDINSVLKYKNQKIYINRNDLNLKENEYLLEDLIGMNIICNNEKLGTISSIYETKAGKLLYITFAKNYYIPYNKYYIKRVDVLQKNVYTENTKDLII